MVVIWGVAAFNFYLIMFLANTFEQVYLTALCLSIADIVSYAISSVLVEKINIKRTLFVSFFIATFGGILIIMYGL